MTNNKLTIQRSYNTFTTGTPDVAARPVTVTVEQAFLVSQRINGFGGVTVLSSPEWWYSLSFVVSDDIHGTTFMSEDQLFNNDPDILEHAI